MLPSSSARLLGLAALAVATLSGCSSTRTASSEGAETLFGLIKPYRIEIVQGNVVTQEVMAQIQPGLGKAQVREILGTPLLTDVFHADRWDYVFTLKRSGEARQSRRLSVFFNGDALVRHEGDELPSESEFVAQFGARGKPGKIPPLEASEDSLKAFAARHPVDAQAAAAQAPAAGAAQRTSYPPLEPGR